MEEIKKSEFENIDFSKLDIGQLIDLCVRCQTIDDVKKVLEQYEKYCCTPAIAYENLGYIFGYASEENRKRLYSLFPVNHPVFGPDFGRCNDTTIIK